MDLLLIHGMQDIFRLDLFYESQKQEMHREKLYLPENPDTATKLCTLLAFLFVELAYGLLCPLGRKQWGTSLSFDMI